MEDAARRISTALTAAKILFLEQGDAFTIAAFCEESGLSRSEFRRYFSTKGKLLAALATEAVEKAKPKSSYPQEFSEQDDWLDRRFRVLERAVTTLEARLDADEDVHAPVLPGAGPLQGPRATEFLPLSGWAMANDPIMVVEAPDYEFDDSSEPSGAEPIGAKPMGYAENKISDIAEAALTVPPVVREIAGEGVAPTELPPIIETSSDTGPAAAAPDLLANFNIQSRPAAIEPELMRNILNNARALAGKAAEVQVEQQVTDRKGQKLTWFLSAAIVFVGLTLGLLTSYESLHSGQKKAPPKPKPQPPAVTIIDATGQEDPSAERPANWLNSVSKQAVRGNAGAQAKLALAYLRGDGVDADAAAAMGWSQLAAQQGEPSAEFVLGTLYSAGVKPNPKMAVRWFGAAASRGNLKAMHNLALAYLTGNGTPKNMAAALEWFGKAASSGYRDSAFDLAVLYERGEGVPQDPHIALRWYAVAASQGDKEAAQRVELLKTMAMPRNAR